MDFWVLVVAPKSKYNVAESNVRGHGSDLLEEDMYFKITYRGLHPNVKDISSDIVDLLDQCKNDVNLLWALVAEEASKLIGDAKLREILSSTIRKELRNKLFEFKDYLLTLIQLSKKDPQRAFMESFPLLIATIIDARLISIHSQQDDLMKLIKTLLGRLTAGGRYDSLLDLPCPEHLTLALICLKKAYPKKYIDALNFILAEAINKDNLDLMLSAALSLLLSDTSPHIISAGKWISALEKVLGKRPSSILEAAKILEEAGLTA